MNSLSLENAKKIADGAEREAQKHNIKIVIAIVDQHGNLKYYRRMDGNNFISVRMAVIKCIVYVFYEKGCNAPCLDVQNCH